MITIPVYVADMPAILKAKKKKLSYLGSMHWAKDIRAGAEIRLADPADDSAWMMILVDAVIPEPGKYGKEGFKRCLFTKILAYTMPEAA